MRFNVRRNVTGKGGPTAGLQISSRMPLKVTLQNSCRSLVGQTMKFTSEHNYETFGGSLII
jgi:hypothetical protein